MDNDAKWANVKMNEGNHFLMDILAKYLNYDPF